MALHPLRESYIIFPSDTIIDFNLPHHENAHSPMLVTLEGIVIEVRLLQPEKAETPMLVTPSGMVIEVRLLQP